MLILCELEYMDDDLNTGMHTTYTTQCIISAPSLSEATKKLSDFYGNDIITFKMTPIEDLVAIPTSVYDRLIHDSYPLDSLETKLY